MIDFGVKMMIGSALPFVGVLHALWSSEVAAFHGLLYVDPLIAPRGYVQRAHLRRRCADCSFHAELRSTIRG